MEGGKKMSRDRGSQQVPETQYLKKCASVLCGFVMGFRLKAAPVTLEGLLRFIYAMTGYVRIGFFVARAVEEGRYSLPPQYHHEFLISGIDMIVISFFICAISCCPFRPIFTLALVFIVGVFAESLLAIYFNFRLLTTFHDNDSVNLQVIRALVPFSFLLHIILACMVTKNSHFCGSEKKKI